MNTAAWVEGRIVNDVDPTGMFAHLPQFTQNSIHLAKTLNAGVCITIKDNGYDCSNLVELETQYGRLEQYKRRVNIEQRLYQDMVLAQSRSDVLSLRADYQAIADLSYFGPNPAYISLLLRFRDLVEAGAPLDIKREYVDVFGDAVWLYNGFYDSDITGNILYGYIGRFIGFSRAELFVGAGYAQQQDNPEYGELACLGDQCVDQVATIVGIDLYNTYGINWGQNELKQRLQQSTHSLHRAYGNNDEEFANVLFGQGVDPYCLSACLGGEVIGRTHELTYFDPCSGLDAESLITCMVDRDHELEVRRARIGISINY